MSLCEKTKLSSILLVLINFVTFIRAQQQQNNPSSCTSNGNYTTTSTYSTNLNTLLNSLSSNMGNTGFYSASVGQDPDRANALALCRGDRTPDQCRICVQSAALELLQLCRNQKQGAIWYEYCMVRYSNDPIHQTQTSDPSYVLHNSFNASDGEQFRDDRRKLLGDLRLMAANGSSAIKAGAGIRNTSSEIIYGLVLCTPDISAEECGSCLIEAEQSTQSCCDIARGVRMLMPNCNLRYELNSFYNETRLRELRVLLPPPPPGKSHQSSPPPSYFEILVFGASIIIVYGPNAIPHLIPPNAKLNAFSIHMYTYPTHKK